MTAETIAGDLTFGHILAATGIDLNDVVVLRHTYTADGLAVGDLTPGNVLDYTRKQGLSNKLGRNPPRHWLIFMADGGRRSRLLAAYDNHGEVLDERTDSNRFFDLRPSELLMSLTDRLVVEWSRDAVNWAKLGATASAFPVMEIADPEVVQFPGFDRVLLSHAELKAAVADSRYAAWRTALGAVQGIYLIADTSTGQLYVGKADGAERLLGRWSAYARDGHGGNVSLRALSALDPNHAEHFQYSILRVFGPSVPTAEVNEAESHFMNAMLSRKFGLNN